MNKPVKLIGLLGASGHGKTTLAEMLGSQVQAAVTLEYGQQVIDFANHWGMHWPPPNHGYLAKDIQEISGSLSNVIQKRIGLRLASTTIKDCIASSRAFGKLREYLLASKFPRNITMSNQAQHRELLEFLSVFLVELVADDFWDQLIEPDLCAGLSTNDLVSVCIRQPSNAALMRRHNGVVVRVINPRIQAKTNPTEARMNLIQPDVVVYNDSNLLALQRTAKILWDILHHDWFARRPFDGPVELRAGDYIET